MLHVHGSEINGLLRTWLGDDNHSHVSQLHDFVCKVLLPNVKNET